MEGGLTLAMNLPLETWFWSCVFLHLSNLKLTMLKDLGGFLYMRKNMIDAAKILFYFLIKRRLTHFLIRTNVSVIVIILFFWCFVHSYGLSYIEVLMRANKKADRLVTQFSWFSPRGNRTVYTTTKSNTCNKDDFWFFGNIIQ